MKKNLLLLFVLFVFAYSPYAGFSQNRVVDRSERNRPEWVDGAVTDFIIATGSGHSIDAARNNAMIRVKELIVSSIANNVRTSARLTTEQVNNNNVFEFLEHFRSETLTRSADIPYLQGISPSRIDRYYWEIIENRNTRARTVYYYVKYPFSRFELATLVDEFVRADMALTEKLEYTISSLETFTRIEELVQYIRELDHMSQTFIDHRKSRANLALIQARTMLGSIQLIQQENILGNLVYNLQLGSRILTTSARPQIRSNCAVVNAVLPYNNSTRVQYDYANCYDEPDNNLRISYRFENMNIENTFYFDIKQFSAEIFVRDDINFVALARQGDFITNFQCHITVVSKYEHPFFIDRIVLNFENLPPLIFENLRLQFRGEGAHRITLTGNQTLEAAQYSSRKEGLNLLSGSIVYGSTHTREARTYRISNQRFTTNW